MIICCPNCNFSRTVDETKIPATAKAATCPRCRHKFRFRDLSENAGDTPEDMRPADGHMGGGGMEPVSSDMAGQGAPGVAEEDLWDRVASLGEHWADDEYLESPGGASAYPDWEQERAPGQGVPWEQCREIGLFKAFFQTVGLALLKPRRLTTALAASRKTRPALVFFLVVALLQTYLFQAWLKLMPGIAGAFGFGTEQTLFQLAEPLSIMLAAPLVWLAFLVALSVLVSLGLRILGRAQATLPGMIRLVSYTAAPLLLSVIPFVGTALGMLWASGLFLFACIRVYRANPVLVLLVILPVYLCLLVLKVIVAGSF